MMNWKLKMQWEKELNAAIEESVRLDSVRPFKLFYEKWTNKGVYDRPLPSNDHILMVSIYKMSVMNPCNSSEIFDTSIYWLKEHGYSIPLY